jgi:hypothetical protein
VRRFLDRYLNYTPGTVDRQMADALNMMTGNFKALVLSRLREDDTINKIQDDHILTNFTIRTITVVQGSPLTFTAFEVKEIHRLKNKQETTDQIVGRYNVPAGARPPYGVQPERPAGGGLLRAANGRGQEYGSITAG